MSGCGAGAGAGAAGVNQSPTRSRKNDKAMEDECMGRILVKDSYGNKLPLSYIFFMTEEKAAKSGQGIAM
ncbi:hypothetical protein AGMMS4956_21550 [Bacteroidia bacterium]|nr:hypothetical protein AGMMS4956_21550 [Bacteroidia bacterium]